MYLDPFTAPTNIPKEGQLTGRARGRIGAFGRVIMQVEYWKRKFKHRYRCMPTGGTAVIDWNELCREWRDATSEDLTGGVVFGGNQNA